MPNVVDLRSTRHFRLLWLERLLESLDSDDALSLARLLNETANVDVVLLAGGRWWAGTKSGSLGHHHRG